MAERIVFGRKLHDVADVGFVRAGRAASARTCAATARCSFGTSSGGFMSFSIWAMRSIDAPSMSCRSACILRAVLGERLAEVLQDLVAGMGERDGGLEVVGRLVGADEPAADGEGDFLFGRKLGVVGEALERGQAGDCVFVHFGGDFLGETFGQAPAVVVGDLVPRCLFSSSMSVLRRVSSAAYLAKQFADLLQAFRRRRLRRETG